MTMSAGSQQPQAMLQSALAWLVAPPAADPAHDLGPLKLYLNEVAEASIQPLQRLKMLELFQGRVDAASAALMPQLLEASLPLRHRLRAIAFGLNEIHDLLVTGTLRALHAVVPDNLANPARELTPCCLRALQNLLEQQRISLYVATTTPTGLWIQAQEVFHFLAGIRGTDPAAIEQPFKAMLALAAAQAESFTAKEISFLTDYLRRFAGAVEIRDQPVPPSENWYWLEENRDLPPVAIARRPAPMHGGRLVFYSCATLARVAGQHILQLAQGEASESLGLPPCEPFACREILGRAQERWATAPRRHTNRHASHYRVELCTGFDPLWKLMHEPAPGAERSAASPITDWMVLNESPSGLALMHIAGTVSDLSPGSALGVRSGPDRLWNIGLIRWARSDNPEHYELGLEMISPSAVPVRIVRPGSDTAPIAPALLFPAQPSLDRKEALMTDRAHAGSGPFTLMREWDGKIQLTACQMEQLALQTAKIEILEFTRDFSPR